MSAHGSVVVQHFATLDYCAPCKCISISSTPYPHSPAGLTTEVFGHLIRSENSTCALYQPLHGNTRWGQPCTNYIQMNCWTWHKTGMSGGNLWSSGLTYRHTHTHTHRLTALCPGLPRWAGTRKVKPVWILLEQEIVSGSGISCTSQICTSLQTDNHASTSLLGFLQAGCPSCRPTNSVKALKAPTSV